MSPSATLESDASLPEYTTVAVRPGVTSRDVEVELVRQRASGSARVEPRAKVPDVSPMLVTSI